MILVLIIPYLIIGMHLACTAENKEFCAWLLFWPIIVIIKAIKGLITVFTKYE